MLVKRHIAAESAPAAGQSSPIVSVAIPAHNAGAYLRETLESLQNQTLSDIEIIVVDDGSSDDTASVAQTFVDADARFHLIRRETPSGRPACGRNAGLRAARGEYFALLDSDDIAVPNRFELSVAAIEATGASIAFGDFHKFVQDDGTFFQTSHLNGQRFVERASAYLEPVDEGIFRCRPDFIAFMLAGVVAINTQTFFARRADVLRVAPFDESLVGGEDLDLFFRMAAQFPVAYIDEVLTLMRVHARSLTATRTDRCIADAIAVRRRHLSVLGAQFTQAERHDAARAVAGMLSDFGYGRWTRGERAGARAALLESWRLHPSRQTLAMYLKAWLPRESLLRLRSKLMRLAT